MDADTELSRLIARSEEIARKKFAREIYFYHTDDFPAISVTGGSCALDCVHCRKKLIERLAPALTPVRLVEKCLSFHQNGARGVLITGGCTAEAKVPVQGFLGAIAEVKDRTDLKVIAHVGLVDGKEAIRIKDAGIDGVCVDVVGSLETTRDIYNVGITPEKYLRTLTALEDAGIKNISPHVCVGLHHGRLHHEFAALELISAIKPSNIVIIGLTGILGTPMEKVRISPEDFVRVVCYAREIFPECVISIGCARGKGHVREEIDRLSVRCAVNAIAVPTQAAYEEARSRGLKITELDSCCALLPGELG